MVKLHAFGVNARTQVSQTPLEQSAMSDQARTLLHETARAAESLANAADNLILAPISKGDPADILINALHTVDASLKNLHDSDLSKSQTPFSLFMSQKYLGETAHAAQSLARAAHNPGPNLVYPIATWANTNSGELE